MQNLGEGEISGDRADSSCSSHEEYRRYAADDSRSRLDVAILLSLSDFGPRLRCLQVQKKKNAKKKGFLELSRLGPVVDSAWEHSRKHCWN